MEVLVLSSNSNSTVDKPILCPVVLPNSWRNEPLETRGWENAGLLLPPSQPHSHLGTLPHPNLNQLSTSSLPYRKVCLGVHSSPGGEGFFSRIVSCSSTIPVPDVDSVLSPSLLPSSTTRSSVNFRHGMLIYTRVLPWMTQSPSF